MGAGIRVAGAGASAPQAQRLPADNRPGRLQGGSSRSIAPSQNNAPRAFTPQQNNAPRAFAPQQNVAPRAFAPQQNVAPRAGNSFSRNGNTVQQGGSSAFQRGGGQAHGGGPVAVPRSYNNHGYSYNSHGYSYNNGYRYYNGHAYYGGHPYYYSYPYYAFHPYFSIGFGIWAGYPVAYPYAYPYYYSSALPYPYPAAPYPSAPDSSAPYPGTVAPAATGGMSFEIDPPDAGLFVDGQYIGVVGQFTPKDQPLALTPGRHHVEFHAAGFMMQAFDVDIIAGQVIPYQGRCCNRSRSSGSGRRKRTNGTKDPYSRNPS